MFSVGLVSTWICIRSRPIAIGASVASVVGILFGMAGGEATWLLEFGRVDGGVLSNDLLSSVVRDLGRVLTVGAFYPPIVLLSAGWLAAAASAIPTRRKASD
jgi:hypothetical protein